MLVFRDGPIRRRGGTAIIAGRSSPAALLTLRMFGRALPCVSIPTPDIPKYLDRVYTFVMRPRHALHAPTPTMSSRAMAGGGRREAARRSI
jgi:hypothetical protein